MYVYSHCFAKVTFCLAMFLNIAIMVFLKFLVAKAHAKTLCSHLKPVNFYRRGLLLNFRNAMKLNTYTICSL